MSYSGSDPPGSPRVRTRKKPKYQISAKFLEGGEKIEVRVTEEKLLEAPMDSPSEEHGDEDDESEIIKKRFEISVMLLLQVATLATTLVALGVAIVAIS